MYPKTAAVFGMLKIHKNFKNIAQTMTISEYQQLKAENTAAFSDGKRPTLQQWHNALKQYASGFDYIDAIVDMALSNWTKGSIVTFNMLKNAIYNIFEADAIRRRILNALETSFADGMIPTGSNFQSLFNIGNFSTANQFRSVHISKYALRNVTTNTTINVTWTTMDDSVQVCSPNLVGDLVSQSRDNYSFAVRPTNSFLNPSNRYGIPCFATANTFEVYLDNSTGWEYLPRFMLTRGDYVLCEFSSKAMHTNAVGTTDIDIILPDANNNSMELYLM